MASLSFGRSNGKAAVGTGYSTIQASTLTPSGRFLGPWHGQDIPLLLSTNARSCKYHGLGSIFTVCLLSLHVHWLLPNSMSECSTSVARASFNDALCTQCMSFFLEPTCYPSMALCWSFSEIVE